MKKWIINKLKNWFIPTPEDITKMAVETIAKGINESGKEEVIAKYGTYADNFTQVQAKVTAWLKDGKIDESEKQELYNALLPLAQKLVEEVKGK